MGQPPIKYADLSAVTDPRMLDELARARRREGTPRVESHAIRAHVPAVFWSFVSTWNDVFRQGCVDHGIKELCRVYVSKSVNCVAIAWRRETDDALWQRLHQCFSDAELLDQIWALGLGLYYAAAFTRTGSLLAPVLAHGYSNGVVVLVLYGLASGIL